MVRPLKVDVRSALSFNGTNSTATVPSISGGGNANGFLSVCLCFRLITTSDQTIASFEGSSTKVKFALASNKLAVKRNDGTTLVSSAGTLMRGKFYNFVYVFNGTNNLLYQFNTTPATSSTSPDSGQIIYLRIGNNSASNDGYYCGVMARLSYYSRVLSTSEINTFLANTAQPFANPVFDYDFHEGGGTTLVDNTGVNNGTVSNCTYLGANFWGNTPGNGVPRFGGSLLYNGDLVHIPPSNVPMTTSARWIDGNATGSTNNTSFGWYATMTNSGTVMFDTTVQYNGMNSLKLHNSTTNGTVFVTTKNQGEDTSTIIQARRERTYVVKAMVKTNSVGTNSVYIRMAESRTTTLPPAINEISNKLSGTNDWTEVTVINTIYATHNFISIELHNDSNSAAGGDAWFTNIRVYEYGLPQRLPKTSLQTNGEFGFHGVFDIAGSTWDSARLNAIIDNMQSAGMNLLRATFTWSYIWPSATSAYNFAKHDLFTNICVSRGIKVLPITSVPKGGQTPQQQIDFNATLAAHYAPLGIDTFEVYNEANIKSAYVTDNSPAHYLSVELQPCSTGLRLGNPNCTVVFSGVTGNSVEDYGASSKAANLFLQGVYDLGGGDTFDVMNYHSYDWNDAPFLAIRNVLDANGDHDKPIWVTEYGLATLGSGNPYPGSLNEQMDLMSEAVKKARKWGIERVYFYSYKDDATGGGSVENNFGFLHTDLTFKPVWGRVKNAIVNGTQ